MASENGQHPDQSATETAPEEQTESAESQIVEEADEPVNPDEGTQAETEAARHGLQYGRSPRKRWKAPRSVAIMLLVVVMVMAVGIYALQWALRMSENNDRGELRALEEREVMAGVQARRTAQMTAIARATQGDPEMVVRPPGFIYTPLTAGEKAKMQELLARFGTQFKPDANQQGQIDDVRATAATPPSRPATRP